MNKRWDILVFSILFAGIGAAGGWYAAHQGDLSAESATEDAAHQEDEAPPELPPATLKNLGVTVGEAKLGEFKRYRSIPAIIESKALSTQPVFAPFGGRIESVFVELSMVVKPEQKLATLIRDPIPLPKLELTEAILKPANESIHRTAIELRKSREEMSIAQTELKRIEQYTGKIGKEQVPLLPRQRAIDLRYQLLRSSTSADQAQQELIAHGLTEEQIQALASGSEVPLFTEESWKRALKHNGLWPASAVALAAALQKKDRAERWSIATIGELSAKGLNTPELIQWLKNDPAASGYFLQIGSLLQRGHSVADVRRLYGLGAFAPIIEIRAPKGAVDWNVATANLRPGSHYETGQTLLTLNDERLMYLKATPVGGEEAHALRALSEQLSCEAEPLVPGAGPILEGIKLSFSQGQDEATSHSSGIFAVVDNEALALTTSKRGNTRRSWQLRSGLRYMLRIPTEQMDDVFVIPSEAVTTSGPHKIIFIQDGQSFRELKVAISYQDEEVAVIQSGEDNALFPGDPIVLSGAFSLGIALMSGAQQLDPHAGHQH